MFAVFGSTYFGFPGSGGLCTIVLAFLAGMVWSDEKVSVQLTPCPKIMLIPKYESCEIDLMPLRFPYSSWLLLT